VDILAVVSLLSIALVSAAWSSARSYFARGRLHGMHEATQEIVRGIFSHYEVDGPTLPPAAAKAMQAMAAVNDGISYSKRILRHHAHLWVFADSIGKACWQKGYEAGKRKMAPKQDRIMIELSRKELMHLVCLAHCGFKHRMPNYRSMEIHRFRGRQEAEDGSFAVEKLEVAIPPELHPFDDTLVHSNGRLRLIQDWWPAEQLQSA
jgi:hypothetical protein